MAAIVPFKDIDISHLTFWLDYMEPDHLAGLLNDLPDTLSTAIEQHQIETATFVEEV